MSSSEASATRYRLLQSAVALFHSCDADSDGLVTRDELGALLCSWGEADVNEALNEVMGAHGHGGRADGANTHVALQAFVDCNTALRLEPFRGLPPGHIASPVHRPSHP